MKATTNYAGRKAKFRIIQSNREARQNGKLLNTMKTKNLINRHRQHQAPTKYTQNEISWPEPTQSDNKSGCFQAPIWSSQECQQIDVYGFFMHQLPDRVILCWWYSFWRQLAQDVQDKSGGKNLNQLFLQDDNVYQNYLIFLQKFTLGMKRRVSVPCSRLHSKLDGPIHQDQHLNQRLRA